MRRIGKIDNETLAEYGRRIVIVCGIVIAGPADQLIRAATAAQEIAIVICNQNIRKIGAGQIVNAGIRVAGRIARVLIKIILRIISGGVEQISRDAGFSMKIGCNVRTTATDQYVRAGTAFQRIAVAVARQCVGEVAAHDVVDIGKGVTCRDAGVLAWIGQVNDEPR